MNIVKKRPFSILESITLNIVFLIISFFIVIFDKILLFKLKAEL